MRSLSHPMVFGIVGVLVVGFCGVIILRSSKTAPRADDASPAREMRPTPPPEKVVQAESPPLTLYLREAPSPPASAAPTKRGKPPARNPAARAALSLIGTDPTAELVWLEAINDPSLPAQERQDLIEDLNEDGFSNRKQPAAADLPLIKARLAIIERLMPDAMDKTNADALAEARKDLVKMEVKLSQ